MHRLVVLVGDLVAPHSVHGLAHFQRQGAYSLFISPSCSILAREVSLEHLEVLALYRGDVMVVAYEAGIVQEMDMRIDIIIPPVEWHFVAVMVPVTVKPDSPYLSVLCHQFGDLILHEGTVGVVVLRISFSSGIESGPAYWVVFACPVQEGIVEMQGYALFTAGLCKLSDDIPLERGCIDYVIIRHRRIEHREAVMMTRGECYILCSRCLDGLHPFTRIERGRIEASRRFGIFLSIQAAVQIPLALSEHAVDSPMDEYSETHVLESLTSLEIVFSRNIIILSRSRRGRQKSHGQDCSQTYKHLFHSNYI